MEVMFPIPQKYLIEHPFLTPEHYTLMPETLSKTKCLLIPLGSSPLVVHESYDSIIDQLFEDDSVVNLYFPNNYHMVLSESLQYSNNLDNYVATYLYRMYANSFHSHFANRSIKGNVLLFGTYRYIDHSYVLDNFSVPYELVEQAFRIYESGIKTHQIKMR